MQLLGKVWSFGSSKAEMVQLWKTFCRGILEQTCVLWDSSLAQHKRTDLERTQKKISKLVLQEEYTNYTTALKSLHLETLDNWQKSLSLKFAKSSIADGLLSDLFPLSAKAHQIETRTAEKYNVLHANTKCFRNSPIISMQRMLTTDEAN